MDCILNMSMPNSFVFSSYPPEFRKRNLFFVSRAYAILDKKITVFEYSRSTSHRSASPKQGHGSESPGWDWDHC